MSTVTARDPVRGEQRTRQDHPEGPELVVRRGAAPQTSAGPLKVR